MHKISRCCDCCCCFFVRFLASSRRRYCLLLCWRNICVDPFDTSSTDRKIITGEWMTHDFPIFFLSAQKSLRKKQTNAFDHNIVVRVKIVFRPEDLINAFCADSGCHSSWAQLLLRWLTPHPNTIHGYWLHTLIASLYIVCWMLRLFPPFCWLVCGFLSFFRFVVVVVILVLFVLLVMCRSLASTISHQPLNLVRLHDPFGLFYCRLPLHIFCSHWLYSYLFFSSCPQLPYRQTEYASMRSLSCERARARARFVS